MHRLYTRIDKKFIPVGWWCDRCHKVTPESGSVDFGPKGEYTETVQHMGARGEVTNYRLKPKED